MYSTETPTSSDIFCIFSFLFSPNFPGTIPTEAIFPSSAKVLPFLSKISPLFALIVSILTLSFSSNSGKIIFDDQSILFSLFCFFTIAVFVNSTSPADVYIFS